MVAKYSRTGSGNELPGKYPPGPAITSSGPVACCRITNEFCAIVVGRIVTTYQSGCGVTTLTMVKGGPLAVSGPMASTNCWSVGGAFVRTGIAGPAVAVGAAPMAID